MKVELLEGRVAELLIRDPAFLAQWKALHAKCEWATVFQTPAYATVWYDVYRPAYAPLLVVERDASGALTGILALAHSRTGDALCAAGSYHAEYQCWLSRAEDDGSFAVRALELVRQRHPRSSLTLRYIPQGTPLGALAARHELPRGLTVIEESRPVMELGDGSAASEWLGRKKHRDRLRRLARGGTLTFEELPDAPALEAVMGRFLDLYDFRQGAVNGAPSSRRDPYHREFYIALMRSPGLLHVTVQRRDDTLLSMHINMRNGGEIALGLLAQTPTDSENSPGVFHIQQLARVAATQGYRSLDLTPGADAYKDRFATRRDTVHVLELRSSREAMLQSARMAVRRSGRRAIERVGIDPRRARDVVAHARSSLAALATPAGARAVLQEIRTASAGARAIRFALDVRRLAVSGVGPDLDSIAALLAYRPGALGSHPRRSFLGTALARFGAGQRSATTMSDGRLVSSAWIAVAGVSDGPELQPVPAGVPSGVAILHDVRLDATAGVSAASIIAGAALAASDATGSKVVIVVAKPGDNMLIAALRELGGVLGGAAVVDAPVRASEAALPARRPPQPAQRA